MAVNEVKPRFPVWRANPCAVKHCIAGVFLYSGSMQWPEPVKAVPSTLLWLGVCSARLPLRSWLVPW